MTLYIDNKPYQVKPGKNLLETCLTLGFDSSLFLLAPRFGLRRCMPSMCCESI